MGENIQSVKSTQLLNAIQLPKQKSDQRDSKELLRAIHYAKIDWQNTLTNFETANETDLIDYYTYKMKACEVRFEYLLRQAKELGIKA